jgi:hypothetical protein
MHGAALQEDETTRGTTQGTFAVHRIAQASRRFLTGKRPPLLTGLEGFSVMR